MSGKYDPRSISIVSSGDPEQDQREIESHIRSSMRIDEGLCPNHAAEAVELVQTEPGVWHCPQCRFVLHKRIIHAGPA
jgi:hypothetical protein